MAMEKNEIPGIDVEKLNPSQRGSELIMLQLRLSGGVDMSAVEKLSGVNPLEAYSQTLQRLANLINLNQQSAGGALDGCGGLLATLR